MKRLILLLLSCFSLLFSSRSLEEIVDIVNRGKTENASQLIDDYIKQHPKEAKAFFVKTLILIADKKYIEAKRTINKAVSLDKNELEYCRTQAQIYEQLDETDLALHTWKKCLKLGRTKTQKNEANKHIQHLEAE